jgi:pimeloyl-ACP methyl ester carboxylesterase
MNKSELPMVDGFLNLQNPEVDDGALLPDTYSVEDIAKSHLKAILEIASSDRDFVVVGMSLGGMIAAVLASKFRVQLPPRCTFKFLVTSANTPAHRAITPAMLTDWIQVKFGDVAGMERILSPFFSSAYLKTNFSRAAEYFEYRAKGLNRQSPKAFMKQVQAVLNFDGPSYYKNVDPLECHFVHGGDDRVFDHRHRADLIALCPTSKHQVIEGLGHMVNIESPDQFKLG